MTWYDDAELAGRLERGSKVVITLLVARCVEPTMRGEVGRGRPEFSDLKTTASGFADHSGISDKTVTAYLKAWDLMAQDGIVPPRQDLTPGVDVGLPDQDKWREYYRRANPRNASTGGGDKGSIPKLDLSKSRVQKATRIAAGIECSRFPSSQQPHVKRMSEALQDIAFAEDPTKPFIAACLALGDLAAAATEITELRWNPGNWDEDVINHSERLMRISDVMWDNLRDIADLGNEGVMLDRLGKTIIDFVSTENKILGMAQMMHSLAEFAAAYRVSRLKPAH